MVSHLQFWARLALGAALALFGLGILNAMYGMGLADRGGAENVRTLQGLDVLSQVTAVLAILANLLAFLLALGCWLKGGNKVPWVVLSISGLGLCYCVYFVLALLGVLA